MKVLILILILGISACTEASTPLEREVIAFAKTHPDQAYEHFMGRIEGGASVEEQALYLYGMGVAHEKLGNTEEAINDYLSAQALGYEKASAALKRLKPE